MILYRFLLLHSLSKLLFHEFFGGFHGDASSLLLVYATDLIFNLCKLLIHLVLIRESLNSSENLANMSEVLLLEFVDFIFVQLAGDLLSHLSNLFFESLLYSVEFLRHGIEVSRVNARLKAGNRGYYLSNLFRDLLLLDLKVFDGAFHIRVDLLYLLHLDIDFRVIPHDGLFNYLRGRRYKSCRGIIS